MSLGSTAVYYVQKSFRKENGKPTTKKVERLGTIEDLKKRFGEEDPIGGAKRYVAELTIQEKDTSRPTPEPTSPTVCTAPQASEQTLR